ncbi:hypothetical protein BKA67DRAFT_655674 [Truncatella angustata]|uniref:Uncharacterized protein n=1 Tax=Truncatella angustata TaxID=152316 RepID=A0A9P8UR12_9PEZI|nr:uncharacterized protein BKA67DRAFT_655674 [Truncatella angustata]KAH6657400.1 hypothetical protein BKA67DRAFT_655674 [Truncatella angustata]
MGSEEEASKRLSGPPEDAPPPYSEVPVQSSSGSTAHRAPNPSANKTQSKQSPPQIPQAQINRQFPPAFSVYSAGAFVRTYTLGEHQSQPLCAISTHSGWSGQPDVVLHSGPSESSPPLAGVDSGAFTRSASVELPPLPGSGQRAAVEDVEFQGIGHGTHSFSIEVGVTGRREPFEWRHSHGAEVDALGGYGSGWKLIRLATDAPDGMPSKAQSVGGGSRSTDKKEVVAVWAGASMSVSKILNFRFVGSGATGVLGERWAVMAVITALRIWDKERKAKRNNAS